MVNLTLDEFVESYKPSGEVIYADLPATRAASGTGYILNATKKSGVLAGAFHHIATNKNTKAGMQWTLQFLPLFKKAGYTLKDALNMVFVKGHYGPHPPEYHQAVFDRINNATKGLTGKQYKEVFEKTLKQLGKEAAEEGSDLNKLISK